MTHPEPSISVFVITYNHEPFISEALKGIVMQKVNCSMEVVIGEDCSSDGTLGICREFGEQYPELIRLLPSERNLKMMGNFLRTLKECRGKFIAFCEGDDYWTDPHKLQKQMDFMTNNPSVVFTFHGSKTFDQRTRKFGTYYKHSHFRTGIIDKGILFEKGGGAFVSPSILFKREILTYPEWFVQAPTGDFPLLLQAIAAGDIGYLDEDMSVVRLFTGVSWSESFTQFAEYKNYFGKEDAYIAAFNKSTGLRFDKFIRRFNYLRNYRLVLQFYSFNESKLQRLWFLFNRVPRMSIVYNLKSILRIFINIRRK